MAACLEAGVRLNRGGYAHSMALASVHLSPLSMAIGVAIYLVILFGPTPPVRFNAMRRVAAFISRLAYVGAFFGLAMGGAYLALTGSAKAAAIGGAAAGLLFALLMGLVAAVAAAAIRLLHPEAWEFAQAWSGAGFSVLRSWWGFRRFQRGRRQLRVFSALRKEWLSETRPRLSARDFLDARRTAIEDSLSAKEGAP